MSTTYGGVDTNFPALITLPSGGDDKKASSVNPAFEGLADRTAFLGRITRAHFGTVGRVVKNPPVPFLDAGRLPTWTTSKTGESWGGTQLWQEDISNLSGFTQLLELPDGCTLQTLYASFHAASGHTDVPANSIVARVRRHQIGSLEHTPTELAAADLDNGSGLAAYEAFQQLAVVVNTVIDNSQYAYYLYVNGESGLWSVAGAHYHGSVCVLSVNDIDVGAG